MNKYLILPLPLLIISTSYAALDCSQYKNSNLTNMCQSVQAATDGAKQKLMNGFNNGLEQNQQLNQQALPSSYTPAAVPVQQAPVSAPAVVPQQQPPQQQEVIPRVRYY